MRVLILGGTGDARELTNRVATMTGVEAIASLAGRTNQPIAPISNVRFGGFGGVEGLVNYLREMQINVLIDATHPFATQISENAAQAAQEVGISRLLLNRLPWDKLPGDDWIEVNSNVDAAKVLESQGQRVFLTIGRQEISTFAYLQNIWFLMRMIDPPQTNSLTPPGLIVYDKGPFHLENEKEILSQYSIDTIVSKNSGGNATYAKIIAARQLGIKVIMVKRPLIPPGEEVNDVESAVMWLWEKSKTEKVNFKTNQNKS